MTTCDFTDVFTHVPDVIACINRNTVHRICSGQVVVSLSIAVKELVENAIDAFSTNIEVRLKDYGSELLEVSDNGCGVKNENFQALTLKHYTSKLRKFTDLESVSTLGFRGEALSSLCALSKLSIITRHSSAAYATKIRYDFDGKIISQAPTAREQGTTVVIEDIFSTLPVRRKEFIKNLKREYSKMCHILYAYCLVSKGIKFVCTNLSKSGSLSTVVTTEGSYSIKENIISLFGTKQDSSLINIEIVEPNESILEEYKVMSVPGESFECEFITSSAVHGKGRSSTDRQFFYVNSRPCEHTKVMKLINEVYRQFNPNQYPFVYLNVNMERHLVDVNVTPDKRQIFLEKEKLLLATLKASLLDAFKNSPSTFKMQNLEIARGIKRNITEESIKKGNISSLFGKRAKSNGTLNLKQRKLINNESFEITVREMEKESLTAGDNLEKLIMLAEEKGGNEEKIEEEANTEEYKNTKSDSTMYREQRKLINNQSFEITVQEMEKESSLAGDNLDKLIMLAEENIEEGANTEEDIEEKMEIFTQPPIIKQHILKQARNNCDLQQSKREEKNCNQPRRSITIRSSMKYLHEALKRCRINKKEDASIKIRFRSEIVPASNKNAEQELEKQISKDMFRKMDVVGQFNLGFIITKLEDDLFIIDQHASDEKYNFEDLQQNTILENQILVNPKSLELTAANEEILIENIEMFRRNGFSFNVKADAPATKKVSLTAIPISKNYIFGKDDIEEMLFMLREDVNHSACRPSRIRSMFASRACRKSVMVGCPLTQTDMRRLVDHMGEINQPWNCPHGRPTMRHLINLQLLQNK